MSHLIPFRGVLYNPDRVDDISRVVAPPYDMISPGEQQALHDGDPFNLVRLTLGFRFPEDTREDNRYTRAARTMESWLGEGVLVRDNEPSIYVYDQEYSLGEGQNYLRRGFIALAHLEEFGGGRIFPHERTFSGPKEDRLKLTAACRANFSQIFSFYGDPEERVDGIIRENLPGEPRFDLTDGRGVRHILYSITDPSVIAAITGGMKDQTLFIADGHHRYETSLRFRQMMKEDSPAEYSGDYDYVMMYFANTYSPGLNILPFHRLIKLPEFIESSKVVKRLKYVGDLTRVPISDDRPAALARLIGEMSRAREGDHLFGVYAPPDLYLLRYRRGALPSTAAGGGMDDLDVNILHRTIMEEVLEGAVSQVEIAYTGRQEEILEKMDRKEYHLAFLLNPTRVEQVREIASAGQRMPPKSTNFHPKLISGLVLNVMGRETH
jgi:uncharacterized protein (DUF1015 family)